MSPRGVAASPDLDSVLVRAIDEGLLVLGEIVRTTIYQRLEGRYGLKREEIPGRVEVFHEALQDMMPGEAWKVMERLIARSLYSRLKLGFTRRAGWTLVDYVNHAKETKRDG